jgi:hypothetical protein
LGIAATLAFVGSPPYDTSEFDRPQTYGRFFDIDPRSADDEQRRAFYASADAPESSAPPDAYRSDGIIVGSGTGSPAVVVLGDSHGCMWAHAIRTVVDEAGLKAAFFCMAGELPFMAIPPSRNGRSRVLTVSEKFDYDVARIHTIERWKPDVVVICARWSIVKPGEPDGLLEFLQQHVKRVVLIESPPELAGVHNHNVAQVAVFRGIHPQVGMRQYWQPGNSEVYEAGRVLVRSTAAKFPNCEIVPTKDLFTADDRVWFLDGRTLLYLDDDHLTTAGAVQVLPRLRKILAPPLTSSIEPRSRGSAPWVRHWVEATPTVIGR